MDQGFNSLEVERPFWRGSLKPLGVLLLERPKSVLRHYHELLIAEWECSATNLWVLGVANQIWHHARDNVKGKVRKRADRFSGL